MKFLIEIFIINGKVRSRMIPRDRVMQSLRRCGFDRLPIRHLAVGEIDMLLKEFFGIQSEEELLKILGCDFREIRPGYRGPDLGCLEGEHGVISARIWNRALLRMNKNLEYPLSKIESIEAVDDSLFAKVDWIDYSRIFEQCQGYSNYARIFGYCEMDFINGYGMLMGEEKTLIAIGQEDPYFLELIERKFDFVYEHIKRALTAAKGLIDIVHFGEDLGSQLGLIISPQQFNKLFAPKFRKAFEMVHSFGAKTMMHSCGSVRKVIPDLINIGLDILDVVQTNAKWMEIEGLKQEFGMDIAFAGSMCVQRVLPFGDSETIKKEVEKRKNLFTDGGFIFGPSHQIQTDTPLKNIIEMYKAAGGIM